LTSEKSMNEHIDRTVKRYSALFSLPPHRTLLVELFVACLFSGLLIQIALHLAQPSGLALGLSLGATFFVLTLASDFIIRLSSVKSDPLFNFRRCSALSVYSLLMWIALIILGTFVDFYVPGIWLKFFLLGFCAALALRLLIFSAASFAGLAKVVVFAALQPVLYVISVIYTVSTATTFGVNVTLLVFIFMSVLVTVAATFVFIFSIDRVGRAVLGVGSFSVLRAFLASWAEDVNAPFERLFERFSQVSEVQVSALLFHDGKKAVKAVMIVPAFHPGPFKSVGSSGLPYMIQVEVESRIKNCVALVPHGLSGHNLDLATQAENQVVLGRTLKLIEASNFGANATPSLYMKGNGATVGCQIINGCALLTLTLAPETMEDLPPELNQMLINEAKNNGLSTAIAVDAHNSINGSFKIDEAIKPLQEAAFTNLQKASKLKSANFQIGVARETPKEFGLSEGMGPGGIAVLVVKVGGQTTAYVTIDGNNMITGLREKILAALTEIGINESEVFTTDTHVVNAVVLNARGYHPVGEAMNHDLLIDYVRRAARRALENLEPAEAAWATDTVSNVKVIGEQQIAAMSTLLDKAMKRARDLAITVFPLAAAILAALLLLL
jgi:predicted neutral ceramidase superfamily lipid hydrolase